MIHNRKVGRLHVLTDGTDDARHDALELARRAASAGADVIQFRDKRPREPLDLQREARSILDAITPHGVSLIVNDRIDLAAEVGAHGVHLGEHDASPTEARAALGAEIIVGGTANDLDRALLVAGTPVDYLGVGPVYPTHSKANPAKTLGLEGLRRIVEAVPVPVIAIGGIGPGQIRDILATGAHGVAILSAVATSDAPEVVTASCRREIERHRLGGPTTAGSAAGERSGHG